jgi:predicted TIM-barrel fold metal-dependent hydrolase
MDIRFGLVSCDSHANLHKDAFLERMSAAMWGDRIPQVREVEQDGQIVERWVVDGKPASRRGVANCAAAMRDPLRRTYPQRWSEVPETVYDPAKRLEALDTDRVDAEVLFFNDPVDSASLPFQSDPGFELACVRAYNDALAQWRQVSDRYIPIALIPYRSGIDATVAEVRRAAGLGHLGVVMVAEPSMSRPGLPHFNDKYWDPLWAVCQELDIPLNWHAHAGIRLLPERWQSHQALRRTAAFSVQPQFVANFVLSGVAERFPRLKLICAETGIGWLQHVIRACDHLWERYRLWTEGVLTRPSDVVRRQVYANFWYEKAGVAGRGPLASHLMWASDYPHGTSTYPDSWKLVDAVLDGVDAASRADLLYRNTLAVYNLSPRGDHDAVRGGSQPCR